MGGKHGDKINILSEEIIGKISAGEVVERPASVVKELVENSIDAGADSIEIEIESSGQTLIRVADNGEGMTPSDAKIACARHSTSKIKDALDLDNIRTLGFRGEALSSIAAVSRMEIITRTRGEENGISIYLEGGELLQFRPAGRAMGTTVEIKNLFYIVSARRKFLKRENTELAEIVNVVGRFILAYSGVEFKLKHGSRNILLASKGASLIERIKNVMGGDVCDSLESVSGVSADYEVSGYVSRPSSSRKDRRCQLFFVNGRFVRSKVLSDAVYSAYRSLLERGRYPASILFLKTSPDKIDINVHPAKLEIKFDDEPAVIHAVASAIRMCFEGLKEEEKRSWTRCSSESFSPDKAVNPGSGDRTRPDIQTEFAYRYNAAPSTSLSDLSGADLTDAKTELIRGDREYLYQMGDCYIVKLKKDSIEISDQHAAHERILYEFFSKMVENGSTETQNLLFPERVDLSPDEAEIMEKAAVSFKKLGFLIEHFGDKSFIVQAIPPILKDRGNIKEIIYDILSDLVTRGPSKVDIADEFIKITACKAAIKAGDRLGKGEMVSLLDQLSKCLLPFTCPHGRPTRTEIDIKELEKRFHRK